MLLATNSTAMASCKESFSAVDSSAAVSLASIASIASAASATLVLSSLAGASSPASTSSAAAAATASAESFTATVVIGAGVAAMNAVVGSTTVSVAGGRGAAGDTASDPANFERRRIQACHLVIWCTW